MSPANKPAFIRGEETHTHSRHTRSRHTCRDTHDIYTHKQQAHTHSRHTHGRHTHTADTHMADTHTGDTHIHTQQIHTINTRTHTETHRRGPPQRLRVWAESQRLLQGWVFERSSAPNLELASLKKDRLADWLTAVCK